MAILLGIVAAGIAAIVVPLLVLAGAVALVGAAWRVITNPFGTRKE